MRAGILLALLFLLPTTLFAQVDVPDGDNVAPIAISARTANRWQEGPFEVWLVRGECRLEQGQDIAVCQEAVFWIEHAAAGSHRRSKVIAYLEGNVGIRVIRDYRPVEIRDQKWLGSFETTRDVRIFPGAVGGKPDPLPGIYQRGMNARIPEFADALRQTRVEAAQYVGGERDSAAGRGAAAAAPLPAGTPALGPGRDGSASSRGATCPCKPSGSKIR